VTSFVWLSWIGSVIFAFAPEQKVEGAPSTIEAEVDVTEPLADYQDQAPLDVEVILNDSSRAYLEARSRLESHPEIAAEALLDRLEAVPPPGPAERKRLLDILARLGGNVDVELFATELRRAIARAPKPSAALEAADRIRPLLRAQGAAALVPLLTLVGDREVPTNVRAVLLEDLVEVSPNARLGDIVALVSGGGGTLQASLRRAVEHRGHSDDEARTILAANLDTAIYTPQGLDPTSTARLPALLVLRARLGRGPEPEFVTHLRTLVRGTDAPFTIRVAAIRSLGALDSELATTALLELGRQYLAPLERNTQTGEVLGALVLGALVPKAAAGLATDLALANEDSPRLATLGYRLADLPADQAWLDLALANPWPEVRRAALSRVEAPCNDDVVALLSRTSTTTDRGGDPIRVVARNALQALGRCESPNATDALLRELRDSRADPQLRTEAARQLVRHGGPDGVTAVAKVLDGDSDRGFARRLIVALRYAPEPTETATRVLCARLGEDNEVAWEAALTLRELHPQEPDICN